MQVSTCPPTPPLSKCPDTPPRPGSSKSSPSRWNSSPKEKSRTPTPNRPSSPENCSICLGPLANKSFTNSCIHQFCFVCLLEWSKVKAECPLCKVAFDSIIHNVRSQDDYDQYHVVRQTVPRPPAVRAVNYHYRAMSEFSQWMAHRGIGGYRTNNESFSYEAIPVGSSHIGSYTVQVRRNTTGTSEYRRSIYERNLWARLQPDVTGRYRECSPEFYRQNPAQLHRLIPFLNRELNVLLSGSRTAYAMEKIMELLPFASMSSPMFRSEVARLIGYQNAPHFCHELRAFASSPFDMVGYDQHVQYHPNGGAGYSIELEDVETSDVDVGADDDDDDIQIIETRPEVRASRSRLSTTPVASTSSSVAVDHETTTRPTSSFYEELSSVTQSSLVVNVPSSSDSEDAAEDVQIVGYVKPRHERTPEIITLSSPEHSRAQSSAPFRHGSPAHSQTTDDLVSVNLGSNSSVDHKWLRHFMDDSSDDCLWSPASSPMPHRRSQKQYRSKNKESCLSPDSQESSSSEEEAKKAKRSKSKKGKRDERRKDTRILKSKHRKKHTYSSDSDDESQPSTSKGRRKGRSVNDHVSHHSSTDHSTSFQSLRKSKTSSTTNIPSPRNPLRSAIVQNNHSSQHTASGSEDILSSPSSGPKLRKIVMTRTTTEEGHGSWRVASSSMSPDGLRHRSFSHHSSKSPSRHKQHSPSRPKKHNSNHDAESSPSKKGKCSHRDSRSSRKDKHKRKHPRRSRSKEVDCESHAKKHKPIYSSDESVSS